MRTLKAQKSALTRAMNSGNPHKVVVEVDRTFNEWDQFGFSQVEHHNYPTPGHWPDTWHRWNMAREDAILLIEQERY